MEILAPAGNMEQALAAINSGCDALYGGLKKYSARKRATNFTVEEYKELITMCHEKDVKFYLTLNTLMKDDEIEEVKNLFGSSDFVYPDAVIIADIGLIKMFRDNFPDVKLHASTQFGACNLEDVRFLETLGFERVVLAREVSLSELSNILKQCKIEIEVFGYGSQCIAFSGQCLWGGMLNKTSGNRGSCIGMCRDVYSAKDRDGQMMYPRDINCCGIIDKLEKLGVASYKIEGRLRNPVETAQIVAEAKNSITDNTASAGEYVGYLGEKLPVQGMLSLVNPRHKYNKEKGLLKQKSMDYNKVKALLLGLSSKVVYETDKADDILMLSNKGYSKFVFAITGFDELRKALSAHGENVDITYKLPLLDFKNELQKIMPLLKGKKVSISKMSQLSLALKAECVVVGAEYTVNIWNSYGVSFLNELGLKSFVLHPEYTYKNCFHKHLDCEQILCGKIPLGYSRACWGELGVCNKKCGEDVFCMHNLDKTYDIEVHCTNKLGYRTIYNKGIDVYQPLANVARLRIVLSGMSVTEKEKIININGLENLKFNEQDGEIK